MLYALLIVLIQRSRDVLFFFDREMTRVAASLVSDISKLSLLASSWMKILPLSKVLPTKDPGTAVLSQYDLMAYVPGGFVHVCH